MRDVKGFGERGLVVVAVFVVDVVIFYAISRYFA